jgi:hypothetical protein
MQYSWVQSASFDYSEQCPPREANSCLVSQEIPRFLWDTMVRYRAYKSPPPDPEERMLNSVRVI